MPNDNLVFVFFIIFSGAALLATLALFARQALIIAYIVLGLAAGPGGAGLITDTGLISDISGIGIIFLLFLLGLDLRPGDLLSMLGKASWVTVMSSLIFAAIGLAAAMLTGFAGRDALLIAAAMMFSSTILGLKLLPTTVLHHQHMGRVIIAILLLQDIIAITILLLLESYGSGGAKPLDILSVYAGIPVLAASAYAFSRFVLNRLFLRFDTIQEYLFLVAVGWCLGMAELAGGLGLSHEIGAFIAGVALASSPVCGFIAERLKPLRDFFLVIFFFSLGAGFDAAFLNQIGIPAALLALTLLIAKPLTFKALLRSIDERRDKCLQMGVRLGQGSEFSLLIAVIALQSGFITIKASYFIQTTILFTFIISSFYIVKVYPTPIAADDRLRRD